MNNQKGFANIALIVLVVVLAGVAGYFVLNNQSVEPTPTPPVNEQPTPTPSQPTSNGNPVSNIPTKTPTTNVKPPSTPFNKAITISVAISPLTGNLKRGTNIVVSWQSTNAPSGSVVYLQLIPPQGSGDSESVIADKLSVSGSYEWHIPSSSDRVMVGGDYTLHGADIVDGKTYQIRASLYLPTSKQCFEGCPPSLGTQVKHADSTSFTIEQP